MKASVLIVFPALLGLTLAQCPAGVSVANCLVDPCRFTKSPCPSMNLRCVSNYCGGCNAEWFTRTNIKVTSRRECRGDNSMPGGGNICQLNADSGPCEAAFRKWTYNSRQGRCIRFTYGGCKGNENRFDSKRQCEKRCPGNDNSGGQSSNPSCPKVPRGTFGICVEECSRDNDCQGNQICCSNGCGHSCMKPAQDGGQSSNNRKCTLPAEPGNCRASFRRWHYDLTSGECKQFIYGGCGGNQNRFNSKRICENQCSSNTPREQPLDVCNQPRKVGLCRARIPKYYYDSASQSCQQFFYGGCGGNDNNFNTVRECRQRCPSNPRPPTNQPPSVCPNPPPFDRDLCSRALFPFQCNNDRDCDSGTCCPGECNVNQCIPNRPTNPRNQPPTVCPRPPRFDRDFCSRARFAFQCNSDRDCNPGICCPGQCNVNQCIPNENTPVNCSPEPEAPSDPYCSWHKFERSGACPEYQMACESKAVGNKPTCPNVPRATFGICVEECSRDKDCTRNEMCCSNGCGHSCMTPT